MHDRVLSPILSQPLCCCCPSHKPATEEPQIRVDIGLQGGIQEAEGAHG